MAEQAAAELPDHCLGVEEGEVARAATGGQAEHLHWTVAEVAGPLVGAVQVTGHDTRTAECCPQCAARRTQLTAPGSPG
jgi:hypothetical protein